MKKATDKLPVTRILIDYQEELMSRIHAYFHPPNEDPDLFLVRLLRKSEDEELAAKILKAERSYYTWSFAFTVTFDRKGAMTRVKETLDYFDFFKIDLPKMPQKIVDAFPTLGEYYQSISIRLKRGNKRIVHAIAPMPESENHLSKRLTKCGIYMNRWWFSSYIPSITCKRCLKSLKNRGKK